MPNFIWTAKDKFGNLVVREVTADSAKDAMSILAANGYTELTLKTDEVMDASQQGFKETYKLFGEEIRVSAEDRVRHMKGRPATFGSALIGGIWQSKALVFPVAALIAYQLYRGNNLAALIVACGLVFWMVFLLCVSLPSIYYAKLIKAADWHQWDEVIALIETLKSIGRFSLIKLPEPELGRHRAKALVGKGKISEALAEYSAYENQPGCPSWLYKAFVAGLYDTAKQHDQALEWTLKSIQDNPRPTIYADLANRYARYKKDPVKAREAFKETEHGPTVAAIIPFRKRCLGIIYFLEGNFAAARKELESSLELMEQTRHQPYRDGSIAIARSYLCLVLAHQGDLEGAKNNFSAAKKYLIATQEDELLAACRQATGVD